MPALDPVTQMRSLATGLVAEGRIDEAVDTLLEGLGLLTQEVARLRLQLAKLRSASRNATSEKVTAEQLSLLALLLDSVDAAQGAAPDPEEEQRLDAVLDEEIEAAADVPPGEDTHEGNVASSDATARCRGASARTRNQWIDQPTLPERVVEHPVPDHMAHWERIGTEETRRLRFLPAHFYREVHRVPVLRNPELDVDGTTEIVVADDAVPPTLSAGSLAAPDVLAGLLVAKYERHQPLHRIHRATLADQGVELPVSTLADWVKLGGEACVRLQPTIQRRVLARWLVRTDATGLRVLDAAGATRGTIWCYVGQSREPDEPPDVLFAYTPTGEGATGPWQVLAGRTGYLQADALNLHDRLFNGKAAHGTEVGCLAHARRRFVELLPDEPRAAYVVQLIRRIYRIETLADRQRTGADARTALRQERTRPLLLEKLLPYLTHLRDSDTPSAPIVAAAQYMLNHWDALTRFVDEGGLPLDNNFVESQLRPVRLGERNYLFAGSHEAATRTAAILTVLATCRAHGVNTFDYLNAMLTRLARPIAADDLAQWTPAAWAAATRAA